MEGAKSVLKGWINSLGERCAHISKKEKELFELCVVVFDVYALEDSGELGVDMQRICSVGDLKNPMFFNHFNYQKTRWIILQTGTRQVKSIFDRTTESLSVNLASLCVWYFKLFVSIPSNMKLLKNVTSEHFVLVLILLFNSLLITINPVESQGNVECAKANNELCVIKKK